MLVLVTGANKGLGYCAAVQLAKAGHHVILTSRDEALGNAAVERIRQAVPKAQLDLVLLDLADQASIQRASTEVKKRFPDGIDVLVNNAAILLPPSDTESLHSQAVKTFHTNYFGTINVFNAFLPLIRNNGRIVHVSSRLGLLNTIPDEALRQKFLDPTLTQEGLATLVQAYINATRDGTHEKLGWTTGTYSTYGTSKVALNALTRIQARDAALLARGITVNSCCPGWCRTDMGGKEATKSDEEGADVFFWLATSSDVKGQTGKFYAERKEINPVDAS